VPKVAEACLQDMRLQSTSMLCHLRDQLGEKRELIVAD